MMRRWAMIALACACVAAVCPWARANEAETREFYLKGYVTRYRGPYRGQVIDAETKAPLAGAVVVALWRRHRIIPMGSVNERYAVREVVTDTYGRFAIEAKDIEEHAPSRTRPPEFCIFQPGYGSFPTRYAAPKGFIGGIFEGAGAVIELPRLSSRQERLENLPRS